VSVPRGWRTTTSRRFRRVCAHPSRSALHSDMRPRRRVAGRSKVDALFRSGAMRACIGGKRGGTGSRGEAV